MSAGLKRWKPYPAYKESGVEWLGQVPEGWEVKRLRFLVATNPSKTEVRLSSDDFVSFVPMEAVGEYGGMQCQERCLDEIGSGYTYFADGDILIAKITPCFENVKGAIAENLTNGIGFGSTEFHVVRHLGTMNATYCFWVSISYIFRKVGEAHMYGAGGQKRIPDVFIKNFHLPTPPLPEQHAIAAFLDQQCAQIDSLIEKKQRMLNLLDEKRRAVITQAVTRGLDPTLPMKDSGVEWLGQVPEGWKIRRLKFLASVSYGLSEPPEYHQQEGIRFIRATDLHAGKIFLETIRCVDPNDIPRNKIFWLRDGDIIVVRSGAYTGDSAIVTKQLEGSIAGFDMILRCTEAVPQFIQWVLLSTYTKETQIDLQRMRAAQPHLNADQLKNCILLYPPLPEQQAIADYLDVQCAAMDSQRKNLEKSIELLREYRASLITHAVTGKIDVRDVAPLQ